MRSTAPDPINRVTTSAASGGGVVGMSQSHAKPVRPEEVLGLAQAVVKVDKFPYLATMDEDQPRLRPVSPVRTDGFTVYVANLRRYHKTGEIAANPKVELCYVDDHHDQVRIAGV